MTDKRLSLEHVIRNIASGNFTPSDTPMITLEHAIKNVVRKKESRESSFAAKDSKPIDEDVGGLVGSGTGGEPKLHAESSKKKVKEDEDDIKLPGHEDKMDEAVGSMGTDKFQGNQFKSVRTSTPHIRPPGKSTAGSEPQAPENVSRQRSLAKEKSSMTMKGNVTEAVKYKVVSDFLKSLRTAPTSNLPAVVGATEVAAKKATPVAARTGTTAVAKRKTSVPTGSVPATPPAVRPSEPKVEVKPETATKVEPKTAPAKVDPKVDTKTDTKVDTKTPDLAKAATAAATIATGAAMAPTTTTTPEPEKKISVAPSTDVKPMVPAAGVPAPAPSASPRVSEKPKRFKFKGPKINVPHNVDYFVLDYVPVKTQNHFAKRETKYAMKEENERKTIQNVPRSDAGDRKELEYVGRKNTKQKTLARNASVKNVIDESRKLAKVVKKVVKETDGIGDGKTKVYDDPPVVINPGLNRIDLNVAEGFISKVTTSPGTLSVAGDAPGIIDSVKKGEYRKAASSAAKAIVGGAVTATPGIGTFLSAMEPTPAGEGENELERQNKIKTLTPGEGIKLQPKQKVKPLAPGEPIKLK